MEVEVDDGILRAYRGESLFGICGGHEKIVRKGWIVRLSTRRQVANSVEMERCQNQ
jgi:hypothetical protein